MNDDQAVGARLREARDYLGLSQQFVAKRVGLGRSALSDIERGLRRVSGPELQRLARLYGTSVEQLLGEASAEADTTISALARTADALTEGDRAEVLRFAQFLQSRVQHGGE